MNECKHHNSREYSWSSPVSSLFGTGEKLSNYVLNELFNPYITAKETEV